MRPPRPAAHPRDRFLECQETVESRVADIIEDGTASGWSRAELAAAVISVADHIMLADAANRQVDKDIEAALRRLGL